MLEVMKGVDPMETRVQALFAAMNQRDFSLVEGHLDETVVLDFPGSGRIEGKRKVLLFLKALLRKYPRLEFHLEEILVDGPRACAVWWNEGGRRDGISYRNRGVTLVHVEEGRIRFISDYFKDTSFVEG